MRYINLIFFTLLLLSGHAQKGDSRRVVNIIASRSEASAYTILKKSLPIDSDVSAISTTDTTVFLRNINPIPLLPPYVIGKSKAWKALYEYFGPKLKCGAKDGIPSCLVRDTLYPMNLNSDYYMDGVISYMLYTDTGHCYEPHYAIVVSDSATGSYHLIDPDFIAPGMYIDRISYGQVYGSIEIYATQYDCDKRKFLRHIHYTFW